MFTRKHSTVASVMETFRRAITDLEDIITRNVVIIDNLHNDRNRLDSKIGDVTLEIQQARGTANRMNDLVFGVDEDNAKN